MKKLSQRTLPAYEPQLEAYHRAFQRDLENIIQHLPLRIGDTVLDMACGSGFYSPLLASRVGELGKVIAVDSDPTYLKVAQERKAKTPFAHRIDIKQGNIERLPFPDATFDAVWCAQSLYSLPDPVGTLRELKRVIRPRGVVAILENDLLHHILLPWPPGFEMRVRQAEYKALKNDKRSATKFYLTRQLSEVFAAAGLIPDHKRTYAHTRHAPLGQHTTLFLKLYLGELRESTHRYLSHDDQETMKNLLTSSSKDFLLKDPFFTMTCLDTVLCGTRP